SAALDELASLAGPTETQVLTSNYLCYNETIVDLCNVDILRLDISHLVSLLRRLFCGVDGREAVALVKTEGVLGLSRTDNVNVIVAQLLCEFGCSQNETAGSVCYEGAIVQFARPGDH